MSRFPIACQTITFGPEQKDHFEEILGKIASCGYDGVEIGFRHVADIPPSTLRSTLDTNRLRITALHVGGNLMDAGQAKDEQREIDRVLDYASELGADTMLYSGLRFDNDLQFANDLSMIAQSARESADRGIALLYHNHDWEFDADWRIMNALLRDEYSAVKLCPDLGWVYRSGTSIVKFLDKTHERIAAVHLKDFSSDDESAVFTELGEGNAPLKEAAQWLVKHTDGMWITLEQDKTELEPEVAVCRNQAYARKLFPN